MKHLQIQLVIDAAVYAELHKGVENGLTVKRAEDVDSLHAVCVYHDFQVIHPHSLQVIGCTGGGKCFIEENHFAHQVRRNR